MPFYDSEAIEQARQVELLTYLQAPSDGASQRDYVHT